MIIFWSVQYLALKRIKTLNNSVTSQRVHVMKTKYLLILLGYIPPLCVFLTAIKRKRNANGHMSATRLIVS